MGLRDRDWFDKAPRCVGVGGWLLGHSFVERQSVEGRTAVIPEVPAGGTLTFHGSLPADERIITYHGDVCTRCGLVVNQQPTTETEQDG